MMFLKGTHFSSICFFTLNEIPVKLNSRPCCFYVYLMMVMTFLVSPMLIRLKCLNNIDIKLEVSSSELVVIESP